MRNELPQVYTHGWSARVRILLPVAEARSRLLKLGWAEKHCGWRTSEPKGGRRWDINGGVWLTSRKPSRSSGLKRRNSEWGTCIYTLSIQQGDCFYLNIGGVRRSDLDRVCGSVLGLTGNQWEVVRWQKYERYMVLSTRDAQSLADAMNSGSGVGKANTQAKEYLVKDHFIPVTIRVRTRLNAEVVVYRINPGRGVTSSWKLEARLNAKASSGKSFCEDDAVRVLDRVLSDLVDQCGLNPLPKPARWEPRDVDTTAEREATLPDLKGLCASAFRGCKPVENNSNTPWPFLTVVSSTPLGTCGAHPLIRDYHHSHSSHHDDGDYLNPVNLIQHSVSNHVTDQWESKVRLPWISLSREIVSLPQGTFSEVVLAPFESPGPFIRTVASQPNVKMAVSVLTSGIDREHKKGIELVGHEIGEILLDHPMCQDDVTHWVLVVDSDVMLAVVNHADNRPLAAHVSDHLAHACRGWRRIAEETGLNILLVTYDARPASGRGPWKPSHNRRDTRVRSLIGHAGRYHAHMRYRVESYEIEGPQWIVVLKDEINGLGAGRIVWSRPGANFGRRGKLQELDDLDELISSPMANQTAIMTSGLPDDDLASFVGSRDADECCALEEPETVGRWG